MRYLLCFQVWEIILMNKWDSQDSYHVGGYSIEVWLQLEVSALKQIKQGAYGRKFLGVETQALQTGARRWSEKIRQLIRITWKSEHAKLLGQNVCGKRVHQGQRAWEEASSWPAQLCGQGDRTNRTLRTEVSEFYAGQTSQSFANHAELELSSEWGENMLEGVSNRGKKNRRTKPVILVVWLVSVSSFGRAGLVVTPETTARQAPQSMGLPRPGRVATRSSGDLPDPGSEPRSPPLQEDSTIWATREVR